MSSVFPSPQPNLDRRDSDPESYAPLLESSQPSHAFQSDTGLAPGDMARGENASYYDPHMPQDGPVSHFNSFNGYDDKDPFKPQDSLYPDPSGAPYPFSGPTAQLHSSPNPHGEGSTGNGRTTRDDDDIELQDLNNSKSRVRHGGAPTPLSTLDTILFTTGVDRIFRLVGIKLGESADHLVQRRRYGLPGQKWPVMAWITCAICCGVLIWEFIQNKNITGSVIATKPSFNFMIGPSPGVLMHIGARWAPCMRLVKDLGPSATLTCPSETSQVSPKQCSVEDICGHGGFPNGKPNQSWRFFSPIYMHVGLVHLALNMIVVVLNSAAIERLMGSLPWLIVYITGGIYGNILGGSFSLAGIPSAGASGAIFAIEGCAMVDLAMHWKYEARPVFKAVMFAIEIVIVIGMGYIPWGVDGLAHLGGLAMGLLLGLCLVPLTSETTRHRLVVCGCRVIAFILAIVALVMTTKNFYTDDPNAACSWCRYLSCIPTSANNQCKGTGLTTTYS